MRRRLLVAQRAGPSDPAPPAHSAVPPIRPQQHSGGRPRTTQSPVSGGVAISMEASVVAADRSPLSAGRFSPVTADATNPDNRHADNETAPRTPGRHCRGICPGRNLDRDSGTHALGGQCSPWHCALSPSSRRSKSSRGRRLARRSNGQRALPSNASALEPSLQGTRASYLRRLPSVRAVSNARFQMWSFTAPGPFLGNVRAISMRRFGVPCRTAASGRPPEGTPTDPPVGFPGGSRSAGAASWSPTGRCPVARSRCRRSPAARP